MSATFGRHSTFLILLIWSLYLSPNNVCIGLPQDVYEKECQGTAKGLVYGPGDIERYLNLKLIYENCTFVRDNLEITYIELTGSEYDFSFLDSIREVNGYVLIVGNYVNRIPLNGLRVIRGWNTFEVTEMGTKRNVSLLIALNYHKNIEYIGLQEIQLTSLVEIPRGDVLVKDNRNMCFGSRTIDWRALTLNNRYGKIMIPSTGRKGLCNTTCHEKCARGVRRYCWVGERDDMCQAERPCGNCRRNCSGIGCSCHGECIGGCTAKSNASSCVACKNFLRGDECVGNCSAKKYNPDTSQWEQPPTTYIFGMRCLQECPESMFIQGDACVAGCTNGYMENKTNNAKKCVPCHETCPKTCNGTDVDTDNNYLHGNNIAQFNHCTIVLGSLKIIETSFIGDTFTGLPKITISDLEILKDVQEITGSIWIDASLSDLSSLSFLRNLRTIGGNGHLSYGLAIHRTALTALNLKSLKQIKAGKVFIKKNPALCYVHTINWTRILTNAKIKQEIIVTDNANSTICEEHKCPEICSDFGCWGPGDDNCVYSGE